MLSKLQSKRQEGFTIIEVLIVLAIAGLIMLIVFLAVPSLQRSQRNEARNTEASRISAAVTECLANRNGSVTACMSTANVNVGTLQQFSTVNFTNGGAAPPASSTSAAGVWYGRGCQTDGSAAATSAGSARAFAVVFTLEPAITRCIGSDG